MKLLGIILMIFGLSQCGSTKLVTSPPFTITKATVKKWVGGQPGISGINVFLNYTSKKNIEFDSMYFDGRITKVEMNESNGITSLIGRYDTSTRGNNEDIVLHSDSKKELQNKIPETKQFPFELKQNQAVISYKEGEKMKFFKIENIKEIAPDFYPQAPPQKNN